MSPEPQYIPTSKMVNSSKVRILEKDGTLIVNDQKLTVWEGDHTQIPAPGYLPTPAAANHELIAENETPSLNILAAV